ncbi:MAG: hypothetical protein B5M48_04315 [Candidatus Omnitrophica bacterium 4484_213]|nr:MAG: hypothetical protein B5M48_04315 [Candidatus Omnitrophica bacterium 4484_213]
MLYLIDKEKVSRAYHDQAVSAIKFLYDCVLICQELWVIFPGQEKRRNSLLFLVVKM